VPQHHVTGSHGSSVFPDYYMAAAGDRLERQVAAIQAAGVPAQRGTPEADVDLIGPGRDGKLNLLHSTPVSYGTMHEAWSLAAAPTHGCARRIVNVC
jgi:hypothetical protein